MNTRARHGDLPLICADRLNAANFAGSLLPLEDDLLWRCKSGSNSLKIMVGATGIEPVTPTMST